MRTLLSLFLLAGVVSAQPKPTHLWPFFPGSAMSYVSVDEPGDEDVVQVRGSRGDLMRFHHNWPTQRQSPHEFYGHLRIKNMTTEDLYVHKPDGTVIGPIAPGNFQWVEVGTSAAPLELMPDESEEWEIKDEHGNEEASVEISGSQNQAATAASAGGEGGIINLPDRATQALVRPRR